jgi:long-subunit fatty acid transport protein
MNYNILNKMSYLQIMKAKFIGLLCLLFLSYTSYSQLGLNSSEGAKALGMGGSGVALTGAYSIFNNQAGILEVENIAVVLDIQRRFSLADLSTVSAGIIKNTKLGSFGLMLSNYGFESYTDQKIGLAYAKKLTDILSVGAQFNILQLRIDNFGSTTKPNFELGLIAKLSEELNLAAHIINPIGTSVTDNTNVDSRFRLGINYQPSSKVEILAEADKILDGNMTFRAGIQYALISSLYLRSGYSTNSGSFSFGLGYEFSSSFHFDAAYSYHQQLGYTPGISIIWNK